MKKAVCFDFDGVIINSTEIQRYALEKSYLKVIGKKPDKNMFQEFLSYAGDSLANIFTKMGLPLEMIPYYRQCSIERDEEILVHMGIVELLQVLNGKDVLCALFTGKDRERTLRILEKKNLLSYFSTIVCSDDIQNPKPHPEGLSVLMKGLGVDEKHIVMVGDATNDILCAKRAGVPAIAVTWGDNEKKVLLQSSPDYVADEIKELEQAICAALKIVPERKKLLFNDFVVAEDKCNMRCEYCLTQTSKINKGGSKLCGGDMFSDCSYYEGTEFYKRLDTIQEKILEQLDVAILKISGGEILLLPGIQAYILKQAELYRGVQVLTNGVLLNREILKGYKEAGNICLQISLDSNKLEGNSYRTKSQKVLDRILSNIELAYKIGVPVEINCVLTDRNASCLCDFLDYLKRYKGGVVVYPFPVRGAQKDSFYMKNEQIADIERVIQRYDEYADILAPKAYMTYLLDFLRYGKRSIPCSLPYMAMGSFEDGAVTPCPNYWFTIWGSVLEDGSDALSRVGKDRLYKSLTRRRTFIPECKSCYTPWDSFNLYMEGILSYQDLLKSPSYAFEGVKEYIELIKKEIQGQLS